MKSKFFVGLILLLTAVSFPLQAKSPQWSIQSQDTTLSKLVTRWAQSEGKQVLWQAESDYTFPNPRKLAKRAHLAKAKTHKKAMSKLFYALQDEISDDAPESQKFKYCVYKTGPVQLAVRTLDQPPCNVAIGTQKL